MSSKNQYRIFIGVPEHVEVRDELEKFGKIAELMRRETFSFCSFEKEDAFKTCVKKKFLFINGSRYRVSVAEPRKQTKPAPNGFSFDKKNDEMVICNECHVSIKNVWRNIGRHKNTDQHLKALKNKKLKLDKELKAILNGSTKIDRAAVTGALSTIVGRLVSTRNMDMKARQSCHAHLQSVCRTMWPNSKIMIFGSTASGIYDVDSDIDFTLVLSSSERQAVEDAVLAEMADEASTTSKSNTLTNADSKSNHDKKKTNNNNNNNNKKHKNKKNNNDEDDDSDDDDDNDAKDNNDDFELQDEADEADEAADVARALHRRVSLAILEQVHKRLRQKRREYGRFRYVDRARVPIISRLHGPARSPLGVFKFDLTCDRLLGVYNSELLGAYSALDTRFVALAKVAKKWAVVAGIQDGSAGFLPTYAIYLLLVTFLQTRSPPVLPVLQDGAPRHVVQGYNCGFKRDSKFKSLNQQTVGELLLEFFEFYAYQFNYETMAISPRRGEFVLKSHLTAELICVLSKDEEVPANSLRRNTLVYDWDEQLLALEDPFENNFSPARNIDADRLDIIIQAFKEAVVLFSKNPSALERYLKRQQK